MKNIYETGLLLDFYGQLLTRRQHEILDLHCNSDYSLAEIAEHLGISRQGVYDNLRRGKALLKNYEEILGLVMKHFKNKSIAEKILNIADNISVNNLSDADKKSLIEVKELLKILIKDI